MDGYIRSLHCILSHSNSIHSNSFLLNSSNMSSLPSSVPEQQQQQQQLKLGSLCVQVLSAYDLPYSEPPQCVSLTTTSILSSPPRSVQTGAPMARHKNRNAFRFSSPNMEEEATTTTASDDNHNSSSVLELVAPLGDLYRSTATIRVLYKEKQLPLLEASYDLNQLGIHETKWVILVLSSDNKTAAAAAMTTTTTTTKAQNIDTTDLPKNEELPVSPTIRVKMTLSGPYRPEIASVVALARTWFQIVDGLEDRARQLWQNCSSPVALAGGGGGPKRLLLLVAAAAAAPLLVLLSPFLAALLLVSLPVLLPIVASTRGGRQHLGTILLAPLIKDSFLQSKVGQTFLYDIGPRPSPVRLAKQILPDHVWGKLAVSLLLDAIGSSSYLLPVLGEVLDGFWAPLQTILIMALYDNITPNLKYVSFFEELLPFTDIIPTATIGWACEYLIPLLLLQKADDDHDPKNGNTTTTTSSSLVRASPHLGRIPKR